MSASATAPTPSSLGLREVARFEAPCAFTLATARQLAHHPDTCPLTRVTDLWPILTSPPHLFAAARAAARRKRRRPDVAAFVLNLETEVFALRRELLAGTWTLWPYRTFTVTDPKPRVISAAPFRDRVVHHALTSLLEPHFERRFIRDSYACRTGYGTHRALDRARAACRRFPYVLKADIVRPGLLRDAGACAGNARARTRPV